MFPSLHSYLSSTVLSMTLGPILAIFVSLRVDPSILLISFAFLFCDLLLFVTTKTYTAQDAGQRSDVTSSLVVHAL